MPLYMSQFIYTPEALASMIAEPQDRAQAVANHLTQVGGKLISFYYTFGEYNGIAIYEAPDAMTAYSTLVAAFSTGFLKECKTTELLSAEEGMEAFKQAAQEKVQKP